MKAKLKSVFALVLIQKLILLLCSLLAFDNSKTRLKNNVLKNVKASQNLN